MVSRSHDAEILPPSRQLNGTPVKSRGNKASASPSKKEEKFSKTVAQDVAELKDYVRFPLTGWSLKLGAYIV
jgi:hypothetical protein